MSWSCGKNGRRKTGKESRGTESGGEKEVRKTEIAMGYCIKSNIERVGKKMVTSDRLETADRKRNEREKMEKEIMIPSALTTVMPRK